MGVALSLELGKVGVVYMDPVLPCAPDQVAESHDARTRDRVLAAVTEHGPITAAALARALGLTPAGIRRHLDALVETGEVAATRPRQAKRGRGRPARSYVAGAGGHRRMPSDYAAVALASLHHLAQVAGPHAVTGFAQRRGAEAEGRYGPVLVDAGPDPVTRTRLLAEALAEDGFAATSRPVGADLTDDSGRGPIGVQLVQGHCPMQEVAAEFPQFCEAETEAFARLLGVHVQRLATLAGGAHACTTYVPVGALVEHGHRPGTTGDDPVAPHRPHDPPGSQATQACAPKPPHDERTAP